MKNTILSSAAALMLLSPTFANPPSSPTPVAPPVESTNPCGFHSGFRAGIGLGYKNHSTVNKYDFKASDNLLLPFPLASEQRRKTSTWQSAFYQGHVAYDWIKNNWLISIELDYRYNPTANKGKIISGDEFLSTEPGDFIFKQGHRHDFGLSFRAGRIITPCFSLYGIANIRLGKFNYEFISEKNIAIPEGLQTSGQRKQSRWGGGLGIGCQYILAKGVSMGPEITYDIYQPIKIDKDLAIPNTNTGTFFVQSSRPRILNVVLKLSKTFPDYQQ